MRVRIDDSEFDKFRLELVKHLGREEVGDMTRFSLVPAAKLLKKTMANMVPVRTGGLKRSIDYTISSRRIRHYNLILENNFTRSLTRKQIKSNDLLYSGAPVDYDAAIGGKIKGRAKNARFGFRLGFVNVGTKNRWRRDGVFTGSIRPSFYARRTLRQSGRKAFILYKRDFVKRLYRRMGRIDTAIKALRRYTQSKGYLRNLR